MKLNKLSLNTDTTKLIFFHSRYKSLNSNHLSIKLDKVKLYPIDHVKYLGMFLDNHLSWDYHINQLGKKLSQANGILAKLRHNATLKTVLLVYHAIFYSHLNYGCTVWGLSHDKYVDKVRILQKECMRIITFSDFNSHTNALFTDLRILKVDDIIKLNLLKLIYDFNHDLLPSDLSNIFIYNSDIHNYNTRSTVIQGPFIPEISTTKYGTISIKYQGPLIWNELSRTLPSINNEHSTIKFKNTIKKHFFSLYDAV